MIFKATSKRLRWLIEYPNDVFVKKYANRFLNWNIISRLKGFVLYMANHCINEEAIRSLPIPRLLSRQISIKGLYISLCPGRSGCDLQLLILQLRTDIFWKFLCSCPEVNAIKPHSCLVNIGLWNILVRHLAVTLTIADQPMSILPYGITRPQQSCNWYRVVVCTQTLNHLLVNEHEYIPTHL